MTKAEAAVVRAAMRWYQAWKRYNLGPGTRQFAIDSSVNLEICCSRLAAARKRGAL